MSDQLRVFFAAALSSEARACAAEAVERLRAAAPSEVRWVPAENQHLTLKFLGEIQEDRVERLVERASAKVAAIAPFEVSLAGFGAFPSAREARILWLGIAQGAAALAKLARKLGRLREPARIELERLTPPDSVAWTVAEVVLYESRLAPDGARYVPLAHLPLGAGEGVSNDEFAPES